ncbi:MAG TPA: hypothetical protein VML55_10015 [Planctomycetaceae bacterium]|nr:hypothetical protein [Planctomycetaceae bacterium]
MIRFECPAGHKIKAAPRFEGRESKCPTCGTGVVVPRVAEAVSETGALRILNECPSPARAADPEPLPDRSPTKACPRCQTTLSAAARICWSCRLDVGPAADSLKSVIRAAARYVKARRAS